jgi:hypothetical protein
MSVRLVVVDDLGSWDGKGRKVEKEGDAKNIKGRRKLQPSRASFLLLAAASCWGAGALLLGEPLPGFLT